MLSPVNDICCRCFKEKYFFTVNKGGRVKSVCCQKKCIVHMFSHMKIVRRFQFSAFKIFYTVHSTSQTHTVEVLSITFLFHISAIKCTPHCSISKWNFSRHILPRDKMHSIKIKSPGILGDTAPSVILLF